jgi:hypothetical protein
MYSPSCEARSGAGNARELSLTLCEGYSSCVKRSVVCGRVATHALMIGDPAARRNDGPVVPRESPVTQ